MNVLLVGFAYLIGSIPFGYIVARLRGVDIFRAGSGNIGATNVGRVLGRKYGILVFLLDFAKGAVTVAVIRSMFGPGPGWLVAVAVAAFLGHLFPAFLGFRGGKGVATGAGVVMILAPIPTTIGVITWFAMLSSSRIVSLASLVAGIVITVAYLILTPSPWTGQSAYLSAFFVSATGLVFIKHHTNIRRLIHHTENQISESSIMSNLSKVLHVVALGSWFGSALFFNFLAAPTIFATFKEVVATAPSDRTANFPLSPGLSTDDQAKLASALAGSAVGPLFPIYFGLEGVCVVIALATAFGWWYSGTGRSVDRWRVILLVLAAIVVAVSVPIADKVSGLRVERLASDPMIAQAAKDAFGPWHMVSLLMSFITTGLALIVLGMASKMPTPSLPDGNAS